MQKLVMTLNRLWEKETTLILLENIFKEHLEISLEYIERLSVWHSSV